jgi:hypothetical protein
VKAVWKTTEGTLVAGHGVASGRKVDARFPNGTLAMQAPYFAERGLDLAPFWLGTLNIDIAPSRFEIGKAAFTFHSVKWHPSEPAEDFSFFDCRVSVIGSDRTAAGLIYYPHPETKPEHEQPDGVLEILTREISTIGEGMRLLLSIPESQIKIHPAPDAGSKAG